MTALKSIQAIKHISSLSTIFLDPRLPLFVSLSPFLHNHSAFLMQQWGGLHALPLFYFPLMLIETAQMGLLAEKTWGKLKSLQWIGGEAVVRAWRAKTLRSLGEYSTLANTASNRRERTMKDMEKMRVTEKANLEWGNLFWANLSVCSVNDCWLVKENE